MVLDRPPVGLRAVMCRTVAAATALALAAAGCSYHSTYVPPEDGRARVLWGPSDDPVVEFSGARIAEQCSAEVRGILEPTGAMRSTNHVEVHSVYVSGGGSRYWSPRYYGPPIVIVRPGFAPPLGRFPVFGPRLAVPAPVIVRPPVSIGRGGGTFVGGVARSGGTSARGGGGGSGGGNFGGGKEAGAILVVLAVIAATALPVVALGLAAAMPESSSKSATAIDMVNAYNDLARLDGTPCTPGPVPSEFAPPQELPQ